MVSLVTTMSEVVMIHNGRFTRYHFPWSYPATLSTRMVSHYNQLFLFRKRFYRFQRLFPLVNAAFSKKPESKTVQFFFFLLGNFLVVYKYLTKDLTTFLHLLFVFIDRKRPILHNTYIVAIFHICLSGVYQRLFA